MTDPKSALRDALRARRAAHLGASDGADGPLATHLAALPAWRSARVVAGFVAVRGEIALTDLLADAHARGVTVALPRVSGRDLAFHRWSGEALAVGTYGIPEPDPRLPRLDPATFDVLLVPGVAFTAAGARLGQGGGYYDRVLARPRGLAVGVAWSFQVVDAVPTDPWDQPVDALLTEAGWVFGAA